MVKKASSKKAAPRRRPKKVPEAVMEEMTSTRSTKRSAPKPPPSQETRQRKDPITKAREKPKSYRLAVVAKCYDCQGCDADPSWQWRVGNCTCVDCPLHHARPYQRMEGRSVPKALARGFNEADTR